MKKILSLLFISFSIIINAQVNRKELGNLVIEEIPEIPQRISERVFQYQNTRAAAFTGWIPSGNGILIQTRFGETAQVHIVEQPGGARKQLTFFPEPVSGTSPCPNKDKDIFLFLKDVGGGEFYQIFSFDMKSGKYDMLTDGKSKNGSHDWNNKGDKFVYSSTKRNGKDNDIYLMDLNRKEELLISEGGEWHILDWAPDDEKIIAGKYVSANESYIYLFDLKTKKLEQINPSSKKISYSGVLWSRDGKGVYIVSDEGSEFKQLRYYDPAAKKSEVITKGINWDVNEIELSEKGDLLAFTVNESGVGKLYLMDTRTRDYSKVEVPVGFIYSLDFDINDSKLGFVINTPKTPGDVYSLDLKSKQITRWTYSEVGGLNTEDFAEPKLIHYPTFDKDNGKQRNIPAFYYKPRRQEGPYAVLIDIHGGPEGQYQPYFNSFTQYLVNEMGIAVIGPNVRGSAGFGKTYLAMDNEYKREESVKDIGSLIEWIKQQPELDASRICVYGGSYGGYMVLASMVHFNDQLKCGIDIVGISNFVTFLENTQEYRRDLRRVEYGDERDPKMREFLEKIAPLNNADKITKPLFVIQGLNDPRVPVTEAEQILKEVRDNGGKSWYLMAKDEGHGFQKKSNRDYMINSIVLFLEENLLK